MSNICASADWCVVLHVISHMPQEEKTTLELQETILALRESRIVLPTEACPALLAISDLM